MLSQIKTLASRIRTSLFPRQSNRDFQTEIDAHLESLTEENLRRGMPPEEARRTARIRLGGFTQLMETNRELRGLPLLETFLQDARYAVRMLRKNPGFTAVAVLTLALGIGANTAIFSVVYAVLMRPLPYAGSAQVLNVFQQQPPNPDGVGWSYPSFSELRDQNHVFSALAGATRHQLTFTGRSEPEEVNTASVTADFFSLFEAQPLIGRMFFPEDAKPGGPAVVIIGENLWRGSLGADPNIIGTAINLDKRPFTVIGVMPAAFILPLFPSVTEAPQIWIPLPQDPLFGPWIQRQTGHWMQVTGRVKPGVSMAQVQAEMDAFGQRIAREFPEENAGYIVRLAPLQDMIVENVKTALIVLPAAVGLVLLIACANIANLLLTRATLRTREIAVRTTLGASRGRIVRQLLSETIVLGLAGGAIGIALAYWGVRVLVRLIPPGVPIVNVIRVDSFVLMFALVLSLFASIVFGLAPAFLAANSNLQSSLREGGTRSGEGSASRRARNVLVVGEIALAMMLLVAAGLLLRSFVKLTSVNPGFEVEHIVTGEVALPRFQYSTRQQWAAFAEQLLRQLHAEPGLEDSAISVPAPIAYGSINLAFEIVGKPPASAGTTRTADSVSVTPDFFKTMGIPLMSGRVFNQRDTMSVPNVAVISKALARTYFPDEDPLGEQISFSFPPDPAVRRQIVGIVGDVRDVSLGDEPKPMMYVPFAQAPFWGAVVIIKSPLSVSNVTATLRHDVWMLDKDLPVTKIAAMQDVLTASVAQPKFRTFLLGLFALMALLLAATGIFGVISYSVSCRTHEIGIRVALGASRRAILGLVSHETLLLISTGLVLGVTGALAAARLFGHLLFGVSVNDPLTLLSVAFTLTVVAALAAYIPARRAMRVDPMIALRHE